MILNKRCLLVGGTRPLLTTPLLAWLLLIGGCDLGNAPFDDLTNYELQQRHRECLMMGDDMAPSTGITCTNIERACARREDRLGRQICF